MKESFKKTIRVSLKEAFKNTEHLATDSKDQFPVDDSGQRPAEG